MNPSIHSLLLLAFTCAAAVAQADHELTFSGTPAPDVWDVSDLPNLLEGSHRVVNLLPLHEQPTSDDRSLLRVQEEVPLSHHAVVAAPFLRQVEPFRFDPGLEALEEVSETPPSTALLALIASDGPVGTPDLYAVPTDKTLAIAAPGFLANDIDLNGEALTAVAIADNVDHGILAAFADGSFTYIPNPGFVGTDVFAYRMRDASNNFSDPIPVFIEVVSAANRTPLGTPDAFALAADSTLSIVAPGFLVNDIDLDGEMLTAVAIADNVDHGILAAFADGSFTYIPNPGFTGTDSFTYRMRDASNNFSDPVLVTLEVYAANRPPIGTEDTYAARVNTTLSIAAPGFLANDIDLDGEALTAVAIADNVDHGILAAFADGSFTYVPNPGFIGTDSFTYRMRDASNNFSDPIAVVIEVFSAGVLPVGSPDLYLVPTDQTLSIAAPGFLANDIDLNGEALTAVAIADNVDHGILAAFADGSFTYIPNADFVGTDAFTYRMRDASNNVSDPIGVVIEVLPAANRTPIGTPDAYALASGTTLSIAARGFLVNDIDLDGEALTAVAIADNVDQGTLAAFADGSFSYTPNSGFTGTDSFTYRMRDASNHFSDPVLVTLEVYAANRPPIGVDDAYAARINTTLSIAPRGFLANDIDLDGEPITAVSIANNVDHGILAAFADGSFTYIPNAGFRGTDRFDYRMRDASNNFSDPIMVTITVIDPTRTCVDDLAARTKSDKVQLTWTHVGAQHYNVYRGTVDGGPYVLIGSTTSTYSTYLDTSVMAGKTYYYVVHPANFFDEEHCQSNQASATTARRSTRARR